MNILTIADLLVCAITWLYAAHRSHQLSADLQAARQLLAQAQRWEIQR